MSLFEAVQTDDAVVERRQLNAAHKRSQAQRRRQLDWKQGKLWSGYTERIFAKRNFLSVYLDVRWDAPDEEHKGLGVDVKQGVGVWSFAFVDKLLLVRGALAGDRQEDFPMSAQPGGKQQVALSNEPCG